MMLASRSSRTSQQGLRSTTGCHTCRRRHVKCDETRPSCKNCSKKNRDCRYIDQISSPLRTPESRTRQYSLTSSPIAGTSTTRRPGDLEESWTVLQKMSDMTNESLSGAPDQTLQTHPDNEGSQSIPRLHVNARNHTISVQERVSSSQNTAFVSGMDVVAYPTDHEEPSPRSSAVSPENLASILLDADLGQSLLAPTGDATGPSSLAQPPYMIRDEECEYPTTFRVSEKVRLNDHETSIFRNYVERLSRWIDSFSQDRPFYNLVPIMALQCPVLLKSCLALSAKQMSLLASHAERSTYSHSAVQYYHKALKAMRALLLQSDFVQSDELLAASIILSTYEMLDVIGDNFGSHLHGLAMLLRHRRLDGSSHGIRRSTYWTWYRQEIWAALHTGRRMTLDEKYWKPDLVDSFESMSVEDITNRVIFIFGQCVTYYYDDRIYDDMVHGDYVRERHSRADALEAELASWKKKLPKFMTSSCTTRSPLQFPNRQGECNFQSLWFIYPQSAVAHQVYHASKIILALHRPPAPVKDRSLMHSQSLFIRRQIEQSREQIFLVANAGIPESWSLLSTQCVYVAGLVTEGAQERRRTLDLIENCQRTSGRQTICIADELRRFWAQNLDQAD